MFAADRPSRRAPSPSPAIVALAAIAAIALLLGLSGCTGFAYVAQAAGGQLDLLAHRRALADVLRDPNVPARDRTLLAEVPAIKRFGEQHGLRPTASYADYVALDRPVAVWVVSASAPLGFDAKKWHFPIVGSVPYLGWFDRDDARFFANELRDVGWDVDLRGAEAYSTLGYFDDPVLSPMLGGGDEAAGELANTVLHESLHATIYFANQTPFNESVASFVGDKLAGDYLEARYGAASPEKTAYADEMHQGAVHAKAMHEAYLDLERLYASPLPAEQKLAEKARRVAALGKEIGARRPINNATLMGFRAYNTGRAELERLFAACGGSFPRMIGALRTLEKAAFAGPQLEDFGTLLAPLEAQGCVGGATATATVVRSAR